MRQEAAVAAMVLVVGDDDVWLTGEALTVDAGVLVEGLVAGGFVAVDGFPGAGGGEGDTVVSVAHHRSVLVVEFFQLVRPLAAQEVVQVGQVGEGVELGAGNLGEGVEEDIVDASDNEVEE